MTPNKFTADDLRNAKKAGFKRKPPKKPKSKTFDSLSNYIVRYNDYVKDLKEAATKGRKLDNLKKAVKSI